MVRGPVTGARVNGYVALERLYLSLVATILTRIVCRNVILYYFLAETVVCPRRDE